MYIVVARANARDTSVPSISLRLVTEDPKQALKEARVTMLKDNSNLSGVFVFRLDSETSYPMEASGGTIESPSELIVFSTWTNFPYDIPVNLKEMFYHDFASLCEE